MHNPILNPLLFEWPYNKINYHKWRVMTIYSVWPPAFVLDPISLSWAWHKSLWIIKHYPMHPYIEFNVSFLYSCQLLLTPRGMQVSLGSFFMFCNRLHNKSCVALVNMNLSISKYMIFNQTSHELVMVIGHACFSIP